MTRAWAILFLIGCGDSGGGTQGPDSALPDAPTSDTPPVDAPQPDGGGPGLKVGMPGVTMPADYSCNGSRVDPPGATAEFTVNGTVVDFQSRNLVPNATVASSIDGVTDYDSKVTDNTGHFSGLRIPANHYRVAFRTTEIPDQIATYELNVPVPPGTTTLQRVSVSHFTAAALPGLVGIDYDPTKALVVGTVLDCQRRTVAGAIATITNTPDSLVFYFSEQDLPVRKTLQMFTNFDGLFTGVNAPPTANGTIRAIDPATSTMIGSISAPLVAGAATFVELPPLSP